MKHLLWLCVLILAVTLGIMAHNDCRRRGHSSTTCLVITTPSFERGR